MCQANKKYLCQQIFGKKVLKLHVGFTDFDLKAFKVANSEFEIRFFI